MLNFSLAKLLQLGLTLTVASLCLNACNSGAPAVQLNSGQPAPTFQTFALDGTPVHFPAAFVGKPLVIRFWADWCQYCEGEMKAIELVYQRHRDQGIQVLAINTGQDKPAVAAFIKKIGVTYPALLDEKSKIARAYGVVGLPTTYFVDGQGIVRGKVVGEADEATFERQVVELLK
ncbi:MAG: TlpA disulfide reductase family protein [Candidatus Dechloromonas phosphoritropha]|jgi:peroxiredoxin|nr:TlpA family protein disulfide reductase [Candidatus Dechloromonas phosphoritropha]MBP8787084.1 TlpA family protein disulfide reductase [Azonexus sp.]MBP9226563.1 TlpA family protein disulfide reductase [Azonexus sp.]